MRKKRAIVKKKIRKKIELREKNDFLEVSKGIEKKMNYNDKRTNIRIGSGEKKKRIPNGLNDRIEARILNDIKTKQTLDSKDKEPISIIVTAYQTQDYIEECLDSIENQTYFINNDNYEILVGVDACQNTLKKLLEICHKYRNLKIFMMESNKGTYITSNTLLDLVNYKNIIRFDSDDIMMPEMINEIIKYLKTNNFIQFKFINFRNSNNNREENFINYYANGVVLMKKTIFDKLGGYMPWRCSADKELLVRGKNILNLKKIDKPLFYRRLHENNLIFKYDSKNKTKKKYGELINKINITKIIPEKNKYIKMPRIPKKIFFFWGNDKMSWMRYMTLYSFRKFNPDWEIILYYSDNLSIKHKTWETKNVQDFHLYNGDNYLDKIKKLDIKTIKWNLCDNKIINSNLNMGASHLSNFLKWSKLYEDGGIYSDLDIIYFKSINGFYNKLINGDYDTAICQKDFLSIGLLASTKTNAFFKDIFINGINNFNIKQYQSAGAINIYNLYQNVNQKDVLNEAKKRYPNLKFYNIPMNLIYYLDSEKIEYAMSNSINIDMFPKESIGYHWYAGHPLSQKYNSLLNHKNYKNHNTTFSKIAEYILNE